MCKIIIYVNLYIHWLPIINVLGTYNAYVLCNSVIAIWLIGRICICNGQASLIYYIITTIIMINNKHSNNKCLLFLTILCKKWIIMVIIMISIIIIYSEGAPRLIIPLRCPENSPRENSPRGKFAAGKFAFGKIRHGKICRAEFSPREFQMISSKKKVQKSF